MKQPCKLLAIAGVMFFLLFGSFLKVWESADSFIQSQRAKFTEGAELNDANGSRKTTFSASQAAAVLSAISIIKPGIIDFYQANDRLPRTQDFADNGSLPTGYNLLDNGSLEVLVGGNAKASILWRFLPQSGGNESWECVSPGIINVAQHLSGCRYDPSFKKNKPIVYEYSSSNHLNFEFGKSDTAGLVPRDQRRLEDLLQSFKSQPTQYVIDAQLSGYTDPMGTLESNNRLAESRVVSVRESLVAIGIDRSLISTRVVGVDPTSPRDCSKYLSKAERIQCFSPSRRVHLIVKLRKVL